MISLIPFQPASYVAQVLPRMLILLVASDHPPLGLLTPVIHRASAALCSSTAGRSVHHEPQLPLGCCDEYCRKLAKQCGHVQAAASLNHVCQAAEVAVALVVVG